MKIKLLSVVLMLVLAVCLVCSCNNKSKGQNSSQSGSQDSSQDNNANQNGAYEDIENLIFAPNKVPVIVCNSRTEFSDEIAIIQDAVFYVSYYIPNVTTDAVDPAEHEIILGKSNREVSKRAYTLLNRLEKEDEKDVSYLVYSDGSSIAIAYEEDVYHTNLAATLAAEFFYDWCDGQEYIAVGKSTIGSLTFDVLDVQEEIDAAETEAQWKIFEDKANSLGGDGAAITAAVKEYFNKVCTDDIVSWLANLYDPAIGGFYFSNGSRNTPGFLPDAESTSGNR